MHLVLVKVALIVTAKSTVLTILLAATLPVKLWSEYYAFN
jgi:hypothetical protein